MAVSHAAPRARRPCHRRQGHARSWWHGHPARGPCEELPRCHVRRHHGRDARATAGLGQAPGPPVRLTAEGTKCLDFDRCSGQNRVSGSDPGIGIGNMRKRAWFKTVMEQVHADIPERNAPVFNLTQPDALRFPSAWPRSCIFCSGAGRLQPRRALAAY